MIKYVLIEGRASDMENKDVDQRVEVAEQDRVRRSDKVLAEQRRRPLPHRKSEQENHDVVGQDSDAEAGVREPPFDGYLRSKPRELVPAQSCPKTEKVRAGECEHFA